MAWARSPVVDDVHLLLLFLTSSLLLAAGPHRAADLPSMTRLGFFSLFRLLSISLVYFQLFVLAGPRPVVVVCVWGREAGGGGGGLHVGTV